MLNKLCSLPQMLIILLLTCLMIVIVCGMIWECLGHVKLWFGNLIFMKKKNLFFAVPSDWSILSFDWSPFQCWKNLFLTTVNRLTPSVNRLTQHIGWKIQLSIRWCSILIWGINWYCVKVRKTLFFRPKWSLIHKTSIHDH
jgi:hypothetical protein